MAKKAAVCEASVSAMLRCSTEELAGLYATGKPAPVPTGKTRGTGIYFPGTFLTPIIDPVLRALVWSGKRFTPESNGDTSVNCRLLPFGVLNFINGVVVRNATSVIDGKKCITLDRSEKAFWPFTKINDEMRLVAPNLYMGPVIAFGKPAPIWYTLEPEKTSKD